MFFVYCNLFFSISFVKQVLKASVSRASWRLVSGRSCPFRKNQLAIVRHLLVDLVTENKHTFASAFVFRCTEIKCLCFENHQIDEYVLSQLG